jgi:hypothetical protein
MVKGLGKYATSPYPSKFILSWLELVLESTAMLLCHDFEESPSGCGHLLVSTRHKCAAHAKRTGGRSLHSLPGKCQRQRAGLAECEPDRRRAGGVVVDRRQCPGQQLRIHSSRRFGDGGRQRADSKLQRHERLHRPRHQDPRQFPVPGPPIASAPSSRGVCASPRSSFGITLTDLRFDPARFVAQQQMHARRRLGQLSIDP